MASNNVQRDQDFADKTKALLVDLLEDTEEDIIDGVRSRKSIICLSIGFRMKSESSSSQGGTLRGYKMISMIAFVPIQSEGCFACSTLQQQQIIMARVLEEATTKSHSESMVWGDFC